MGNMLMFLRLLCYVWFILPLTSAQGVGRRCYGDSCYIITESGRTWNENQQSCKNEGGDLVSMETNGEWEYINNQIQQYSLPRENEWHIGLMKNQDTWEWVNGKKLTIKKWQRGQPSGDGNVAVMAKNYPRESRGLFNDLDPGWTKPYICEIPRGMTKQPALPVSPSGNPGPAAGGQQGASLHCGHDQLFDFEDENQISCFKPSPPSSGTVTLSADKATVKHGTKSLKWKATASSSRLRLQFSPTSIPNNWLGSGGVKVWFYKSTSSPRKTLTVGYKYKRPGNPRTVGRFQANLNFEGWRGIWVKFNECKLTARLARRTRIHEVEFVLSGADTIYVDLLQFEKSIAKVSRDKIVPPISPYGLNRYPLNAAWQQSYKWSQKTVPASPLIIDRLKEKSLDFIEGRLKNWYCDELKASPNFPSGGFLVKRWKSLLKIVKKAHKEYDGLEFEGGKVVGPPLFCRNCKQPKKIGFIMEKILLPLSLEYNIRNRANDIKATAAAQLSELNSGNTTRKENAYKAIAGEDTNMKNLFKSYLPRSGNVNTAQVVDAIDTLNLVRLNKINDLLNFVKQQGFADGSGLGSLDHEMNLDGAGFIHSLFLLSDSLSKASNKSRLLDLIKTAKWYCDFGEIYQSPTFEFKGTTADRMITLMLFRLMIVLVMPSDNADEVKAKIRDMDALVRWMNNALDVNEGLGGVMKPDFVGHHHKAFYGPAYVPQALHTAALVQYLLGGTEFALSASSVNNIRRGLETLRIICVKYSTPNSVNGRFPNYFNKAILKKVLPAYAYISVSHQSVGPSSPNKKGIIVNDVSQPEMFLRLYKDPSVNSVLGESKYKRKYYYDSLGSLDIMQKVESVATSQGKSAEHSPEGHWSKNFAVLSIHRRKDWAVTAKGFNSFLWDYENSGKQNVFGMFASHGALQIANSEGSLEVHDVAKGWDWAKVPGATTIALGSPNIDDLKMKTGRFYNRRKLAGGLTFKGTSTLKNGIFGMDFKQPTYGLKDWRKDINFEFKKSVFFFENLLVCLGSQITASNTNGKIVQTTLFQDKLASGSQLSIKINGVAKTCSTLVPVTTPSITGRSYTTLTDTQKNFYYIPNPSKSMLKVHVQDQRSKTDDGKTLTQERYGTAWLEHGSSPSNANYEYAVLIDTTSYVALPEHIATSQQTARRKFYKVERKNNTAHIVQFLKSPKSGSALSHPIYGYVIFRKFTTLVGPVARVNERNCLIMAEESATYTYLSISSPGLNLAEALPSNSGDVGERLMYHSSSRARNIKVTLKTRVQQSTVSVQVHGNPVGYTPDVKVDAAGKIVTFNNLKNGFSVEVKLRKK